MGIVDVIVFEEIFSVALSKVVAAGVTAASAGKRFCDLIGGEKLLLVMVRVEAKKSGVLKGFVVRVVSECEGAMKGVRG